MIGGSYPGALSAWFRAKYPQWTVASWSSSGVVQPIENFYDFDYQIYNSTLKSGKFCPEAIQVITKQLTIVFNQSTITGDTTKADEVLDVFEARGMRYDDFMFYFADIFVESV